MMNPQLHSLMPDTEIEDLIDDHLQADPYADTPPSRRADKDIERMLAILDELERGSQ